MTTDGFKRIGVMGAGFMGTGIAESAAASGVEVSLYEPISGAIESSRERIATSLARSVERGKRSAEEAEEVKARVTWSDELGALDGSELVIEAIVEDVEVKVRAFK